MLKKDVTQPLRKGRLCFRVKRNSVFVLTIGQVLPNILMLGFAEILTQARVKPLV